MAEQLSNIPIYILYIRLPNPAAFSFDQFFLLLFLNIDVFIDGNENFDIPKTLHIFVKKENERIWKKNIWKIQKLFVPL